MDAEIGFYRDFNANPYRSQHKASRRATQIYDACRVVVADFIGVDSDEVIFTQGTTGGINLLAYAWGLKELKGGDRIVLPIYEHHSNLLPWQMVCRKTGAELHYLQTDESGAISDEEIARAVTDKTKLISCAHISNVYACASPLEALVAAGKAVGARVFLDCAQSVAHLPLELHSLEVDAAAFSGHKVYAPMGIGVLYVRRDLLADLEPFLYGGEMIDQVARQTATYQSGPRRFEAGTPNVAGTFGLVSALDYLQQVGWDYIQMTEAVLMKQLLDGLQGIKGINIVGSEDMNGRPGSLISFSNNLLNTEDIAFELDAAGVAVRAGTHCAQPLHNYLKLTASLRISPCFYNTSEEIDRCLQLLDEMPQRINRRIISSLP
jgi:cysteine desulfurase/selenocysteine lyase